MRKNQILILKISKITLCFKNLPSISDDPSLVSDFFLSYFDIFWIFLFSSEFEEKIFDLFSFNKFLLNIFILIFSFEEFI